MEHYPQGIQLRFNTVVPGYVLDEKHMIATEKPPRDSVKNDESDDVWLGISTTRAL